MSNDKTAVVRDAGHESSSYETIEIHIDGDGDVQFTPSDGSTGMWITPSDLTGALVELGVLPQEAQRPASTTPSERVRQSWRKAAASDENERPAIRYRAAEREVRRALAAKLARPTFYRDDDGDTWRSAADGRLTLYRVQQGRRVEGVAYLRREGVERLYGPLTEVPDPFAFTWNRAESTSRATRRADAVHQGLDSSTWRYYR